LEVNESYQKWSEHKSNSKTKKCLFQITKVSSLFLFLAFVFCKCISLLVTILSLKKKWIIEENYRNRFG
jgi:hypothetical protein